MIAGYEAIRQAKLKALTVDSGLLSEIDKQIKDLESQRPLAKAVEDIALIDEKLQVLQNQKHEIELKIKVAQNELALPQKLAQPTAMEAASKLKTGSNTFTPAPVGDASVKSIEQEEEYLQEMEAKINRETDARRRDELMQTYNAEQQKLQWMKASSEERRKIWEEENEFTMGIFGSITAGFSEMWQRFIVKSRAPKNDWDAVWLAMRNTAVGFLGEILKKQLENYLVDTAAHKASETTKTATTGENALLRVATTIWETTVKIATWAGELVAYIAKEIAMTAVAVVQGGIRIAIILAEAAASVVKAIAETIASLGPIGLMTGAAIAAAAIAMYAGIKKALGFKGGGQFEPDQRGYIEGGQTEIIAPRKNFEDIMRNEMMPMIARQQMMMMQSQRASTSDESMVPMLVRKFSSLEKTIKKNVSTVTIQSQFDVQKYVRAQKDAAKYKLAIAL